VRLTLLTVSAPVSAVVTVAVRGGGTHPSSQSRIATAGGGGSGTRLLSFPRFARALRAGTLLEIKVTKAGEIGKRTRFLARRHRLPLRQDSCLSPTGLPLVCPSS